jgi:methylphosphotriester-DNA--protein-cysteine methyltransferase
MIAHSTLSEAVLRSMIRSGKLMLAGNNKLKIYGNLRCRSGMRMKIITRVFFRDEIEARENGYRPCKKCMRTAGNHR